jgi:hypothetical protein
VRWFTLTTEIQATLLMAVEVSRDAGHLVLHHSD